MGVQYSIIAKVPFPDCAESASSAQGEEPDYPLYLAAQEIVQASGRTCEPRMTGMRC
jgi:hypothetical protein